MRTNNLQYAKDEKCNTHFSSSEKSVNKCRIKNKFHKFQHLLYIFFYFIKSFVSALSITYNM